MDPANTSDPLLTANLLPGVIGLNGTPAWVPENFKWLMHVRESRLSFSRIETFEHCTHSRVLVVEPSLALLR